VDLCLWFLLIGKFDAEKSQEFQVTTQSVDNEKLELVVLRMYGEYLFTAPLSRSTQEIAKRIVIIKLSDDYPTSLSLEKVGPLKVKP
jgi:hypothetical protein